LTLELTSTSPSAASTRLRVDKCKQPPNKNTVSHALILRTALTYYNSLLFICSMA
jgi:hypothetical protein